MIGFIGAAILYVILVVMFLITKNLLATPDFNRVDLHLVRKKMRQYKIMSIFVAVIFILSASVAFGRGYYTKLSHINFEHVHGMAITNDGSLMLSTHVGIYYYTADHTWTMAKLPQNDYMGFTKVNDGFFSSGHPGLGSKLPNPIGIIKVDEKHHDKIIPIGFTGEEEFHGLSAGYYTHILYAYNITKNSMMTQKGLYVSKDEGKSWSFCQLKGVDGDISAFAASPTYPSMVVVGTNKGLYISRNFGQTFKSYFSDLNVTSVIFSNTGELVFGGVRQGPHLMKWNLVSNHIESVPLPSLDQGGIAFIAVSNDGKKVAIASFDNNVYVSDDQGHHWKKIATDGVTS